MPHTIAVAGKGVYFGILGKRYGGFLGGRVIDYEISDTVLAISSRMGVHVRALTDRLTAGKSCGAHKSVPKLYGKIIGTGLEAAVLQIAVVG